MVGQTLRGSEAASSVTSAAAAAAVAERDLLRQQLSAAERRLEATRHERDRMMKLLKSFRLEMLEDSDKLLSRPDSG